MIFVLLGLWGCTDADGDGTRAGRDCDDRDPARHLDAEEVCDGIDNDCDGLVDEDVAIVAFLDRDGDGFGRSDAARRVCELPEDGATTGGDCDDGAAAIHPGAPETCDGIDNDCDGDIDDGVAQAFYLDADGDGAGIGRPQERSRGCFPPEGFAATDADCDDADPHRAPHLPESCDGVDNDCDERIDEDLPLIRVWRDADGDGAGDPDAPGAACGAVSGWSPWPDDCDDADSDAGPHLPEIVDNAIDEDCDGWVDELEVPGTWPTVPEAWAAAPEGGVVQLQVGRFEGPFDLTGRDVTLAGRGCGRTRIDGVQAGSTLLLDRGGLADLTVSGGTGSPYGTGGLRQGGGLWIGSGAVRIERVCFEQNQVSGRGGALAATGDAEVELIDSLFTDNRSNGPGGAVWVAGGSLEARGTTFNRNTSFGDQGGALASAGASVTLDRCALGFNTAARSGQALALLASGSGGFSNPPPALVTDSLFFANGGSLATVDHGTGVLDVVRTAFVDNERIGVETHDAARLHLTDVSWVGQEQDLSTGWDPGGHRERPQVVSEARDAPDLRVFPGVGAVGPVEASLSEDTDRDGLPDGWARRYELPPDQGAASDPDADGLQHAVELGIGTDPRLPDTDGDGSDDGVELASHRDPTDPRDQRPAADAGPDRASRVAETVRLGGRPWIPTGAPTTTWSVLASPIGSAPTLLGDGADLLFTPDVPGAYTLQVAMEQGGFVSVDVVTVTVWSGPVVPDDHPTLEAALAAASPDDAVFVRAGTLAVDGALPGLPAGNPVRVVGLGPVELVPASPGPVFWITDHDVELYDLTISGGRTASTGGGLRVTSGDVRLERVTLRGNRSDANGGAISLVDGDLVARGLRVIGNTSSQAAVRVVGSVDVEDCVFDGNQATNDPGLVVVGTDARVHRCIFAHHVGEGAALDLRAPNSPRISADVGKLVFYGNEVDVGLRHDDPDLVIDELLAEANHLSEGLLAPESGAGTVVLVLQHDGTGAVGPSPHPAELRPTRAVFGAPDNLWTPRGGSSVFDSGWIDGPPDPDGSRSDLAVAPRAPAGAARAFDLDRDGASDAWERTFGFDPGDPSDARTDPDGDGLSNQAEHALGTDPNAADTDRDGEPDATDASPLDPRDHRPVAVLARSGGTTAREIFRFSSASSFDPDGDPLTTTWRLVRAPSGQALGVLGTDPTLDFVPPVAGRYAIELQVEAGGALSTPTRLAFPVLSTWDVPSALTPTLADALPYAGPDDRILLHDGVHLVDGPLTRGVILEGGANTTISGRLTWDRGTLELRSLTWADGLAVEGGALACDGATLVARDVTFTGNLARRGGALYAAGCSVTLENAEFLANEVLDDGGALYLTDGTTLAQARGAYRDNQAERTGGAIRMEDASATLDNVLFDGNHAPSGRDLYRSGPGALLGRHLVVLAGPEATDRAMRSAASGSFLDNSVIIGPGPQLDGVPVGITTLQHDLVNGPFTGFVDLGARDLRVPLGSPLRDVGSGSDPDGSGADLGLYGGPLAPDGWDAWQIDADVDGLPDAWELQFGVDLPFGDPDLDGLTNSEELARGTRPDRADTDGDGATDALEIASATNPLDPNDRLPVIVLTPLATLTAPGGVSLDAAASHDPLTGEQPLLRWSLVEAPGRSSLQPGLFAEGPVVAMTPDTAGRFVVEVTAETTGLRTQRVEVFVQGEVQVPADYPTLTRALEGVAPGGSIRLDGSPQTGPFTIDRPLALEGAGSTLQAEGFGVLRTSAPVTLRDLTITGGRALRGGGLRAEADIELEGVVVEDNVALIGGGIQARQAGVRLLGSSVVGNAAVQHGGGLHLEQSPIHLDDVILAGNRAAANGGGIWAQDSPVDAHHLLAVDLQATAGAGIWAERTSVVLDHTTFGHLDGDPAVLASDGLRPVDLLDSLFVGSGAQRLFDFEGSGMTPTLSGGGFFQVGSPSEPFVLTPLDPAFDFGVLSDDGDWTNDDWGRSTSLPTDPGAFGD